MRKISEYRILRVSARFRLMFLFGLMLSALMANRCDAQTDNLQTVRVMLPNGVRLLLKPETDAGRVVISIFVRVEPAASTAEAAVREITLGALFYGNANRTRNGILTLADEVGGSLETLQAREYAAVTYAASSSEMPEAAHLLCDCLKDAAFAPDSLQRAQERLYRERSARRENGFLLGYDAVSQSVGYVMPSEADLKRVTQVQAQDYFRRHYIPARTVVSIAGQFRSEQAINLFSAFLADYGRMQKTRISPLPDADVPQPLSHDTAASAKALPTLILPAPASAAYALLAASAPSVRSPDYPAFTVLLALLGGGHASRLFQQARETLGLGYEVGALWQTDRDGPLLAFLQWNPQRTTQTANSRFPFSENVPDRAAPHTSASISEAALKLLQKQFDALLAAPPSLLEVERARNFAIGQDALRHERVRDRAFFSGWYETLGRGFAYDRELPRLLAAVTPEDVFRVARVYLKTPTPALVAPFPAP